MQMKIRFVAALAILLCTIPAGAAQKRRVPIKRTAGRSTALNADTVNNPKLTAVVGPRSSGSAVLRAQVLLDRAHFPVGEIDASYGANMRNAVKAYQAVHGLPERGIVNAQTWEALNSDTGPVLAPYTIADPDLAHP